METPHRAPAAGETPPPAAAESNGHQEIGGSRNQDLLISLKMLAVKRAETGGRPHLADAFDLRMLPALGVILLESFKVRVKEYEVHPTIIDRLVLATDPDVDASVSSGDSEVLRWHNKDQPKAK